MTLGVAVGTERLVDRAEGEAVVEVRACGAALGRLAAPVEPLSAPPQAARASDAVSATVAPVIAPGTAFMGDRPFIEMRSDAP
jgi:hypothetical protein